MSARAVYLMYHELAEPGRPLVDEDPGYARYAVAAEDFRQHLSRLRSAGARGLSVGEALAANGAKTNDEKDAGGNEGGVVITFDDGCETDLTVAAPLLEEAGMKATFYVVSGHVGRRGFVSKSQLRELAERGFEVGSHSVTHSLLTDLAPERVRAELADSKDALEQLTGRRVAHFSCPGGRWSPLVARLAAELGYESVATSRVGANGRASDRFRLARVAVMRHTTLADFERCARAEGLLRRRAQDAVLSLAKRALGNGAYQRLRSTALRK